MVYVGFIAIHDAVEFCWKCIVYWLGILVFMGLVGREYSREPYVLIYAGT